MKTTLSGIIIGSIGVYFDILLTTTIGASLFGAGLVFMWIDEGRLKP